MRVWRKGDTVLFNIKNLSTGEIITLTGVIISDTKKDAGVVEFRIETKRGTSQDLMVHFNPNEDIH
jgi:hypothetical protein